MAHFSSYDGTRLGYHVIGEGAALVCLPGGPGRASDYFGDLGGLGGSRRLVMLDTRGAGESADASDPLSYRCDRLVEDVEALRAHLGLERMDLLGHSAAGALATLYAARYPQRLSHLVLVTPALLALGIDVSDEEWRAVLSRRSHEPWYADAMDAVDKSEAGDESPETRRRYLPFFYGRWDDAARAHADLGLSERSAAVRAHYWDAEAFDPPATREAIAGLAAPVLLYAGEIDANPTTEAVAHAGKLFPNATVTVQPGAAHFPWLDDPAFFTTAVSDFLN